MSRRHNKHLTCQTNSFLFMHLNGKILRISSILVPVDLTVVKSIIIKNLNVLTLRANVKPAELCNGRL